MKILVTGSSGFIGSALVEHLKNRGHRIIHLVRRRSRQFDDPQIFWHEVKPEDLSGIDAVVHLAGESIFARWTDEKKQRIIQSRVETTRRLSELIAALDEKPGVMISCSAVGYYGDRGNEPLTEVSASGDNFLAEVCRKWEEATEPARAAGIRVVHTRLGIVLHPSGSSLQLMYWPFKLGVAGNLGIGGRQYMPWVSRDDVVGAIEHVLNTGSLRGPVNVVAPETITNAEFTHIMKKVLTWPVNPFRYWAPPLPAIAIRLAAGQMGREMLLASQKVLPVRLQETGYKFKHPTLEAALREMV